MAYTIERFDDFYGFILFDSKKNESSADILAEVISKSRKQMFRVVHNGVVINQFDYREKK